MKKLLITMLTLGVVAAASAQHGRVIVEPGIRIGVSSGPAYHYGSYRYDRRADEINREYDHRIWEVKHDRYLSHRQKRRAIRELDYERSQRLRELRRWR